MENSVILRMTYSRKNYLELLPSDGVHEPAQKNDKNSENIPPMRIF